MNNESDSIHERMQKIINENDVDRKAEISDKIRFGDNLTKIALSTAFWGFWIFWLIVALT